MLYLSGLGGLSPKEYFKRTIATIATVLLQCNPEQLDLQVGILIKSDISQFYHLRANVGE